MSKFTADPVAMNQEGNKMDDIASRFNDNNEKIYSKVEEILTSQYVSPAAREIGRKILKCKPDLDEMTRTLAGYANYCHTVSNKVNKTEANIIDSVNAGGDQA